MAAVPGQGPSWWRPTRLVVLAAVLGVALLAAPWPDRRSPPASEGSGQVTRGPLAGPGPTTSESPRAAQPTTPSAPPADLLAGLLTHDVPAAGTGDLVAVPGSSAAPGTGPVRSVRIEVEGGVPVDPEAFAGFVMTTLNDPRGWGHGGAMSFARTAGPAPLQVVLASPATTERLCRPLDTGGTLSCRNGERVVITHHRWVEGTSEYAADLTAYRRYVVNHEVGHALGHGHVECPAPGAPAPVMQQQTFGLDGCAPNPWPHP